MKKLGLLLKTGLNHPREFLDHLEAILTMRLERYYGRKGQYSSRAEEEVLAALSSLFTVPLQWDGLEAITSSVRNKIVQLQHEASFPLYYNSDISLARVCFAASRLLRPEVVIETGTGYGVTTAFILKSLHVNGKGRLYSIDLPPLSKRAEHYIGYLVPEELKDRWTLYRGASKRVLPTLLSQLGKVDMFVHDSLHTYWNIHRELELINPYLQRPAIIIADDIQDNSAFLEWVERVKPTYWAAFREEQKYALAGLAVFF